MFSYRTGLLSVVLVKAQIYNLVKTGVPCELIMSIIN
jgi:hypothetical protein